MNASTRLLALLGAASALAVAGCSSPGTTTPGTGPSVLPVATSTPLPPAPPPPSPKGSVDGIDVTIASQDAGPLRPGGDPMDFTVTLTNTTAAAIPDVDMVVYLGHCGCGRPGASMMPAGTMRMLDPATNAWVSVPYVRAGTGMDFLTLPLVAPFDLKAGQTVTYQLQMQMNADPAVTSGNSEIEVAIKTAGHDGWPAHVASFPITVEP